MNAIEIVEIEASNGPLLDKTEALFRQLYDFMKRRGLMIPLAEGGEMVWRKSMEKALGRFGHLVAALRGCHMLGFAHGTIRLTPEYLGGQRVGYITNVYVLPEMRGQRLGRQMIARLENWFLKNRVHSFEVQVLCQNEGARQFWEELGYEKELLQLRKLLC
jgi:ribosomal protein S18 acetylase RimI-like enzyme